MWVVMFIIAFIRLIVYWDWSMLVCLVVLSLAVRYVELREKKSKGGIE